MGLDNALICIDTMEAALSDADPEKADIHAVNAAA